MSQILLQPANAMITLENVNKWYGQFHVLKNINFEIKNDLFQYTEKPIGKPT